MSNQPPLTIEWEQDSPAEKKRMGLPPTREIPWRLDVLLVEDDPADAWLITRALRDDWRVHRTILAETPQNALYQIVEGSIKPHLVLLDINMPGLNGFKFLDAFKEIPTMARVPVVMLTTSRYANDVRKARARKARSYVIKPDNFEDLQKRLANILTEVMKEWKEQWNA